MALYEDDGEDLGYLRGEFLRTPVSCTTADGYYEIVVDKRTGEGYELGGVREFIFKVYTENLPDSVMIDGVKARKGKVWTIDRKAGVYCVALPDDGLRHVIRLHRNGF